MRQLSDPLDLAAPRPTPPRPSFFSQCTYKFNEENTVDWKASNSVGGFLQRCEEVRKYAFGCMAVLGTQAPFEISGVWVLRGHTMGPMLDANPDAEYYEWTKLDVEDPAARVMASQYWCDVEKADGKVIYDSKIFK